MKKAPTTFQADGALGEQLSFIPPAPFCPSWPKSNTLALQMFFNGRSLDHEEFIGACSSWRPAAVVFQLKMIGWPIDTIDKSSPSREHSGRIIALCRLPGKYVAKALALKTGVARAK